MITPNPGEDIWVNSFYGPKCGVFQLAWPEKKKVLIEFHGEPELVALDECFVSERDCYAAAAAKKQREAMAAMKARHWNTDSRCSVSNVLLSCGIGLNHGINGNHRIATIHSKLS